MSISNDYTAVFATTDITMTPSFLTATTITTDSYTTSSGTSAINNTIDKFKNTPIQTFKNPETFTCTFDVSLNNNIKGSENWNTKDTKYKDYCYDQFYRIIGLSNEVHIVNINIIVPNKVVEVTIYDGNVHVYKQICQEPDEFSLKFALALAYAKHLQKTNKDISIGGLKLSLTTAGIEEFAKNMLVFYKEPNHEINRAIKAYNKWVAKKEKEETEEKERQAVIARRKAKNKKRKEKMLARKKQDEIDTITKAILAAKNEQNKQNKQNKQYNKYYEDDNK